MRYLILIALCGCQIAERADVLTISTAVARVRVDVDAGDVRVQAGDVDHVAVQRVLHGPQGLVDAGAAVLGDTLTLTGTCPVLTPCGVDLLITVPPGVAVDVRTGAGRVELYDLDADARAQVGEGSLAAHGLAGGRLHAQVAWGDVSASFAGPPTDVDIGAGGGDVTLLLPAGGYALDLDAFAGERVSGIAEDAAGAPVNVRAQAGQVYVGRG